mgnify:CR=1 FL=1|jgi:hypothetical protein
MIQVNKTFNPIHLARNKNLQIDSTKLDLSESNLKIYFWKLFENRTKKDKSYISKYNSIGELEEDIYGDLYFPQDDEYIKIAFQEVYSKLDKEIFFAKVNEMIAQYGNMLVVDSINALYIKSDESLNLLSYLHKVGRYYYSPKQAPTLYSYSNSKQLFLWGGGILLLYIIGVIVGICLGYGWTSLFFPFIILVILSIISSGIVWLYNLIYDKKHRV